MLMHFLNTTLLTTLHYTRIIFSKFFQEELQNIRPLEKTKRYAFVWSSKSHCGTAFGGKASKVFSSANMQKYFILAADSAKQERAALVPKLARSTADLANGMELAAKISRCGRLAVCSGPLWAPSGWPTVSQGQAICPQDEMDFKSRYINRTDHNCPQAALRVKDNRP
jgi:hypothetical protein